MRPAPVPTGLLERTAQLAAVRAAVREVAAGGSATVLVHGRPGTGRSALLDAAAALARGAGLTVVTTPWDAAPGAPAAPLAVLDDDAPCTAAPPEDPGEGPLLRVTATTAPAAAPPEHPGHRRVLALRPLSAAAVRALLAAAYGDVAAGRLLRTALAATGGVPAVLCATLRRWPAPPPAPDEFAALADQVGRHHLRRTLAGATERTAALVEASAVAAGDFSFRQVGELAGVPPGDDGRARTDLAATGLFDSVAQPCLYDRLVAERALGLLDDGRRRELHEHAARLARRDGLPQAVLGRLVARTRLTGPWVPAALYAAGVRARRRGDDDAACYLERAVDHGPDEALRTDILLELAKAQAPLRPESADRTFRRVLETSAPDRSAARLTAADALTLRGSRDTAPALGTAAADGSVPEAERRTLRALRELALEPGRPAPAALPAAAAGGGPRREFDAAEAAAEAWHHCLAGRGIGTARRLADTVLTRAEGGLFAPRLVAARALAVAEDVERARHGLRRVEAEARRRRMGPAVGHALLNLAEIALRTGERAEALDRLTEAVTEVPRRHWHPRVLQRLTALEALIALESGRPDLAESVLASAAPARHEHGFGWAQVLFAHGVFALDSGRRAEASARLHECGRILLGLGCVNPAVLPWRPALALARAPVDPHGSALLLADSLAAARAWGAAGAVSAVHLWAGLATTGATALRHLRTAIRLLPGTTARKQCARTKAELALALLDAGRPGEGRRLLDEAAGAAGGPPGTRALEVADRFAALSAENRRRLSRAQLRVALLAADGLSNKAIAGELAVGVRTVEMHLTDTYRALGLHGRADLAAALGRP
ncbi:LuxR C-terminal-related transcriptional regulator [Streptomyces sp. NPDC050560]|uniref:LuxR C-terminal-related transcriptional regulator n=1 Tax=Streptomyces sp. NPDC050560 TaxID=3365630 RepID=UPI0037B4057D